MQIAFWSPYQCQGVTSNMAAVATLLAIEHNKKTVITHSHFDRSSLEAMFAGNERDQSATRFTDMGIEALERLVRHNLMDNSDIRDYTTTIINNRLDMVLGTNKKHKYDNMIDVADRIFDELNQVYEAVLIDLDSNVDSSFTKHILNNSDLVVINVLQRKDLIERCIEQYMDKDNYFLLLGKYNSFSVFNKKNIKRKYRLKQIASIPYNIEFADQCQLGNTIEFFMRNRKTRKYHKNHEFMEEVRKTTMDIFKKLKYI